MSAGPLFFIAPQMGAYSPTHTHDVAELSVDADRDERGREASGISIMKASRTNATKAALQYFPVPAACG